MRRDPLLGCVRFAAGTLLTPGEQDVLRRFCSGLRRLARLPERVAVFGSRVRGGANERSDLDVAVLMQGERDPALESAVSAIALAATRHYRLGGYGIALRPIVFYAGAPDPFLEAIRAELEVVWTRA